MVTGKNIDYRQFTRAQLLEALANIDARRFPENHRHLVAEIASRASESRAEAPPEKPKRISRLAELRGEVTGSIGTKVIYGAFGAFYLCLPLFIIWGFPQTINMAAAVVLTAMIWVVAAIYLFGFAVTYKFESGVVTCLWFGRHVMWEDKLDTLERVESNFIRGLPSVYFVWPDHKRRLWLRMSDLDSGTVVA
jgi:hypothetical protein